MIGFAALLVCILAFWCVKRDGWSPISAGLVLWALIALALWWNPLQLVPLDGRTVAILLLGVGGIALPGLLAAPDTGSANREAIGRWIRPRRLAISTVIAAAASLVGAYVFRNEITGSAGTSFGNLTPQQVRFYQNQKNGSAGLLSLFQACFPVLGVLGVLGYLKVSKWYVIAVVISIALSLQNPGRLFTVSLIVQIAVVYLYAHGPKAGTRARFARVRAYALLGTAALSSLFVFIWLGDKLGKNESVANAVNSDLPAPLVSPLLYLTGGLPATSAWLESGADPFDGRGSSAFVFVRVWNALSPGKTAGGTVGNYVDIPYSFNVFTGFGQAYWDGGFIWVLVLSLALGATGLISHRRALRGHLGSMWVSSITAMLMVSLPMQYRMWNLDTLFALVAGLLLLHACTSPQPSPAPPRGKERRGRSKHPRPRKSPQRTAARQASAHTAKL